MEKVEKFYETEHESFHLYMNSLLFYLFENFLYQKAFR